MTGWLGLKGKKPGREREGVRKVMEMRLGLFS